MVLFLRFSSHLPNCHTLLGWAKKSKQKKKDNQLIQTKCLTTVLGKLSIIDDKNTTNELAYVVTVQSCSLCANIMLNGFVNELILRLGSKKKN